MITTVGQFLINEALPEDLRDNQRVWTKKSMKAVMEELYRRHPEEYKKVVHDLYQIGRHAVTSYGGPASLSLDDLKVSPKLKEKKQQLKKIVDAIAEDDSLTQEQKEDKIVLAIGRRIQGLTDDNMAEGEKEGNSFSSQILSGSRGNKSQFAQTRVGDLLVADHKDRPIPIPVLKGYAEGTDPVEYWAASYGARKGQVDVKMSTAKAGFFSKQTAAAAHRLIVSDKDCGTLNSISVDPNDADSEGTVLQNGVGQYEPGTILTPRILNDIARKTDKIYIRSPITCEAKDGVCQRCAGVRERGTWPRLGDNIGVAATQAMSEPITQSQLSSKHTGGVVGQTAGAVSGFDLINQMVQVPKSFKGGAPSAQLDGKVSSIDNAPQGGKFVIIGQEKHYVPPGQQINVRIGENVEAGDVLSSGIPNPAEIVKFKGIGEGRRYFVDRFRKTLEAAGVSANRRNIELLARGAINHVRVTDTDGPNGSMIDDIVEYDSIARRYKPRAGSMLTPVKRSVGRYLERPALHYSIGTRVTKKVADNLQAAGIGEVDTHEDEPSFQPEMGRIMESLGHADDWMVRLGGFHLKKGLLGAAQRGSTSTVKGSPSYIPALAQGSTFGKVEPGKGY